MYTIKWDDGETEYYAILKDLLIRKDFLVRACGYKYGRDFYVTRILDGREWEVDLEEEIFVW